MRSSTLGVIACAIALAPAGGALAGFYQSTFRSVSAPPIGAGSFGVAGAALADGRLLAATGTEVYVETAVGSGAFALAATLDSSIANGTDPAFLEVSPDGSRLALGAGFGRPLVVFDTALLDPGAPGVISAASASVINTPHFGAAWRDGSTLAVSRDGGVDTIDVVSGNVSAIVTNIGGASAGVAFDGAGNLYTANGFDLAAGGSETGEIRVFTPAELAGGPADFEAGGAFVAELLSASPLRIDAFGNLIAGGGDFAQGDIGSVVVYDLAAGAEQRLDPLGTGGEFYSTFINDATGELIVTSGSDWFVYAIPSPGAAALAPIALVGLRRRRRAG